MNALLAALMALAAIFLVCLLGAGWEAWQAAWERRRLGMRIPTEVGH